MSHDDEAKRECQTPSAGIHGRGDHDRQIQTEEPDTPAAPPLVLNLGRTVDRVPSASIIHGTESVNLNSSRAGSSVLQSARQVDIRGGNFNTAGTQQLNLTINVGEQRPDEDPQEKVAGSSRDNIPQGIREEATSNGNDRDDSTTWTEPVQTSYDIYYRHIAVNRRGSPLWIPGPNQVLPVGYRRDGTTIGDVGIITEFGSFDCLFNIYLPHNDPINLLQVPDSFTPFTFSHRAIQKRSEFGANSHLSSPSVKKARSGRNGITFESSASEGAILAMPCGSNSEDIASIFSLRKYVATHADAWYRHIITELGREVQNGDVRLVTGWDKTKAWGMATFSKTTAQQEPLLLQFKPIGEGNADMAYGWDYSGSANARAGPGAEEIEELRMADPPQDGIQYNNQTLFVRTLNVNLQDSTWNKLACDVELFGSDDGPGSISNTSYSQLSRGSGFSTNDSNASNSATRSENGGYNSASRGATSIHLPALRTALAEHPSKGINEMLLKLNPTAKMAITDDNDWISVIRDDDTILPSAEALRERIMTSQIVRDEGGLYRKLTFGFCRLRLDASRHNLSTEKTCLRVSQYFSEVSQPQSQQR
ncbi:hypothetical protein GALMADRAFT_1256679 [Galerina marginata CBS 339.88]|uniref:Uncharacterized protein n=1 Tax=Galerina marginata (strain CBS 339.88) TaxID=685588 RepID=A0A067T896_GALM3|nr:hypothetical protein GALMADRAFT_1256679 [Galerina marginata CBS 339.88]